MAKQATEYYQVNPWKIVEKDYDLTRNQVSESIFSLGNEYMGVRGIIEEGVEAPSLIGTYFNGIYALGEDESAPHYKGIVRETHFMVNSVNFLYTSIYMNNKKIDLTTTEFTDFERVLDMNTGVLTRKYTVLSNNEKLVTIVFERFISMVYVEQAYQRISFIPHKENLDIELQLGLDNRILHWGKTNYWNVIEQTATNHQGFIYATTKTTNQGVCSGYIVHSNQDFTPVQVEQDQLIYTTYHFQTTTEPVVFEKCIVNVIDKKQQDGASKLSFEVIDKLPNVLSYEEALKGQKTYYEDLWKNKDIEIIGDEKNQQGIRYCIFQLHQTYQGVSPTNNIGAKGLTGEAYSGHAFWDTETYCLPYFIFNNEVAAKNLLLFRYSTLEKAKARANSLDCDGACYPIATLNGDEACTLWQHASLQFQPSTGVAYGIFHYVLHTGDIEFLYNEGITMLTEISRFLLSRGQWNQDHTKFGFYAVMGPDEFQMMVNHNTYTNFMAKKTFKYTLETWNKLETENPRLYSKMKKELSFLQEEIDAMNQAIDHMYILFDEETLLYEQHEGFYDLPHIDVNDIPVTDFPLYSNWSYDRIYRNDMIKQPDVLMFMFLYNQDFTLEEKRNNYDYYEPKTIHESSLSPSIHSIFASELGKDKDAIDFFGYATRMDLDDYNRNTNEGLHTTSIAAAWMNIIYGFGGFRSDKEKVRFSPSKPDYWQEFTFRLTVKGRLLKVVVKDDFVVFENLGEPLKVMIYDKEYLLDGVTEISL